MSFGQVPGIDTPVSRLVQGTIYFSSSNQQHDFALLDELFALGCNTFDAAHVYGGGDCERVLGRWIAERGNREQVVILDKGAHPNEDRNRVTPFDITADLHDCLARLGTDYIDLFMLHRDDPSVPVGPIVDVLNEHLAAGRIRAMGGSNWTHQRIEAANEYAEVHGLAPFAASSPNFTLARQVKAPWEGCISIGSAEGAAARDWYTQTGMPVFAWSSLARGLFTGRLSREAFESGDHDVDGAGVHAYCYEENFQRLDRVRELAGEKGLSIPQVALAYVFSHPLDVFALVGCGSGAEMEDNIRALNLKLSEAEMAWLDLRSDRR